MCWDLYILVTTKKHDNTDDILTDCGKWQIRLKSWVVQMLNITVQRDH